jgi:hypothetical protein
VAAKRKWTYWHKCVYADDTCENMKVNDVVGMDEPTKEWHGHSDKLKGFYVKARFVLMGKLPYNLHEIDPKEASRRIKGSEWS